MIKRISKRWAIAIISLLTIIILGITAGFTKDDHSEAEIIGQKDAPTNIWIGEEVD